MLLPPPISTLFPYTTLFRSRALIDPCRVDEAVADHPFSLSERGQDRRIDVVAARRREQDRLDLRPKRLGGAREQHIDRKSTRLNSSHLGISYAVFCLKKKNK